MVIAGQALAETARAELHNDQGKKVGAATLEETPHGVLITLDLDGVPPGTHALHIHEVGKCEPPFKSAGGHFNPTEKKHGVLSAAGMHAGDLPNISVPESGKLKVDVFAAGVTLGNGKDGLFDADGSSLVLHAGPDDYKTDPAGEAGARVACGVIVK
jgi:Cu-Zn family superoxide dismutase